MNINEELKILKIVLSICEGISTSNIQPGHYTYDITPSPKGRLIFNNKDSFSILYGDTVILYIENYEYPQLRTDSDWTICFEPSSEHYNCFSFLNSGDDLEAEEFIDSFTYNARIMTEEEYFQATCIHPDMPPYENISSYLKIMDEMRRSFLRGSLWLKMKPALDYDFYRKLRRTLIHEGGININVY